MKKYLPACILLVLFNGGALWLFLSVFSTRYFVIAVSGLILSAVGALFFSDLLFIKRLRLRPVLPTDDIYKIWHNKAEGLPDNADRCYIAPGPDLFSLHFSNGKTNGAVFSESFLELLSQKELEALVCYYKTGFATGWSLFLTLLSLFCAPVRMVFFILESPFRLFLKDSKLKASPFCFLLFLTVLSRPAQGIFLSLDQKTQRRCPKAGLPKALWKMQSLYELEQMHPPDWMIPVFSADPLTKKSFKWYISFQPKIRLRIKALTGTYPP